MKIKWTEDYYDKQSLENYVITNKVNKTEFYRVIHTSKNKFTIKTDVIIEVNAESYQNMMVQENMRIECQRCSVFNYVNLGRYCGYSLSESLTDINQVINTNVFFLIIQ